MISQTFPRQKLCPRQGDDQWWRVERVTNRYFRPVIEPERGKPYERCGINTRAPAVR